MSISATTIDSILYKIEYRLMSKYGCAAAERYMYPLKWYINTGRASSAFLKCLYRASPDVIARDLSEGGSYEEAVNRICSRVGYIRNENL